MRAPGDEHRLQEEDPVKHCSVCLKLLITLSLWANTAIAVSGNPGDMRPPDRRYESPKSIQQQRSNKQAQALFRRIITNHMKIFVDTSGAKGSPAIVVGLVTQMADVVEGFGSRELNKNLPPDGDTLFGIGSISKVFTGLMLAKAVTDGDVCLSARANEWLDDTIQINDCITLKHLVTHFSGLPNFPDNITTRDSGVN